jgi:hypothetical protein
MMPGGGGNVNTTLPLVLGILCIPCCWPAGVFAIIFSVQAKNLLQQGQIEAARGKAKVATIVSAIVVGLGAIGAILYLILMIIGIAAGAAES